MGMDSPLTMTTTSQPRLLLDLDWSFPLHIECESQYFGLCTRINLCSKSSVSMISSSFIPKSWFSSIFSNPFLWSPDSWFLYPFLPYFSPFALHPLVFCSSLPVLFHSDLGTSTIPFGSLSLHSPSRVSPFPSPAPYFPGKASISGPRRMERPSELLPSSFPSSLEEAMMFPWESNAWRWR